MKRYPFLKLSSFILILALTACHDHGVTPPPQPALDWVVATFAGNVTGGSANGQGTLASFQGAWGVASDATGNIYVADGGNNEIRKITPAGLVSVFAGTGVAGAKNGMSGVATFNNPEGVAVDATGNVYVTDYGNNMVRKITTAGNVTTLAGSGTLGSDNGPGATASFRGVRNVAVDLNGTVFVADQDNDIIRKISASGDVTTLAGNGSPGNTDGAGAMASFKLPQGVAVDGHGNIYVADQHNQVIRKITSTGIVSTFAGNGMMGTTNGTGDVASFGNPSEVAIDVSGNIYIADTFNNLIRKIDPDGVVSTIAGNGIQGAVDGLGKSASFYAPFGIAVDPSGSVYVADAGNNLIRKLSQK